MERYRCDPQVIKACKIKKLYGCDGYYLGAGCRCAKDNQSIMAETEYQELQAYRATGLTVERAAELGKADQEGRVLQYAPGDTVYDRFGRPWEIVIVSVITRAYHDGPRHVYHRYHCGHSGTDDYCVIDSDDILTREEAEKALEAAEE